MTGKRYCILALILAVSGMLAANSIFSSYGFAEQYYSVDTYSLGMGETGYSDLYRFNTGFGNPSLATSCSSVVFSSGVTFGYMYYSDKAGNSFRDDGLFLPYFSVAVPFGNHHFAFNFNTVSAGNYESEITRSYTFSNGTTNVTEINRIESNIYRLDAIYALHTDWINVGLGVNYYTGQRSRYVEADFEDDDYVDAKYETDHYFHNYSWNIGLSKRFSNLSFGVAYRPEVKLEGDTEFNYVFDPYVSDLDDSSFELPERYSLSVTWRLKQKFKFSSDFHYELWEKTDNAVENLNSYRASIGIAYDPMYERQDWYASLPVRVGFSYRQLPFEVNENRVNEMGFSGGFSVPFKSPGKEIHFAVQYTLRGDKNDHGLQEKTVMFTIGTKGFDIFKKRKKNIEHRDIPQPDKK